MLVQQVGQQASGVEVPPRGLRQVAKLAEPNVLFLSLAARSRQEDFQRVYDWFRRIAWRTSNGDYGALSLPAVLDDCARLADLLRAADTGIVGTEMVDESDAEYAARISRMWSGKGKPPTRQKRLHFRHQGVDGSATLALSDQSMGTQHLYRLGRLAFRSLDLGSLLVVDELDSSLHPYLAAKLINLFRDPDINTRGAQLIFTGHDVSLLGRIQGEQVLLGDNIWFTEKNECGATELFAISDFKPRGEENRERRYLAGRYGAVPRIDDELFAAALAARKEHGDVPAES
ncbi:ATP/GTP-binding protein [Actinomadura chokoriensis]|uniref:AAA family ATPase n=1 Tax=Actinomadura chokoriensis TaxID=454156 RepID=A0ABV4QPP7_9ACTN